MNMATQMSSVEQLQRRHRARRQLSGAVVLLALVAWLVPWVLDSAPRSMKRALPVTSAGSDAVAVSVVPSTMLPSGHDTAPPVVSSSRDLAAHESVPVSALPQAPAGTVAQATPASGKAQVAIADGHAAENMAAARAKAEEAVVASHAAKTTSPAPDRNKKVAHDAVSHAASANTSAAHAGKTQYAVQLGVFGKQEHVQQLRKRLQAIGMPCYTETMPSGATRVRVGPYANRAGAEHALATLRLADLPAQLVLPGH